MTDQPTPEPSAIHAATPLKFLRPGRIGTHSDYQWPECGEWVEVEGALEACVNGLHYCHATTAMDWADAELYVFAPDGETLHADTKHLCRRGRLVRRVETWNDCTQRLFAADCAEHVQPADADPRSLEAIRAARRFARGEASDEELAAARDAAWDAARAAAGDAAWDAAWDAARAAARAAARDAERQWQAGALLEFLNGART